MEISVRKDLNDMVNDISLLKIKTRYNERKVVVVTLFNGEKIEFKDTEGLYELCMAYRKSGENDFILSKKLIEEEKSSVSDVSDDKIDSNSGTYVCVMFELKDGSKFRLFPSKFTDKKIIDIYYKTYKNKQLQSKNQAK